MHAATARRRTPWCWLLLIGALAAIPLASSVAAPAEAAPAAAAAPVDVWVGPTSLTTPGSSSGSPQVAPGPGPLAITYASGSSWFYRMRDGATWTAPAGIGPVWQFLAGSTDAAGHLHSVFDTRDGLQYQDQHGPTVDRSIALEAGYEPDIASDASGTSVIVATTAHGISAWTVRATGGDVEGPVAIEPLQPDNQVMRPVVVGDGAGGFLAVWV